MRQNDNGGILRLVAMIFVGLVVIYIGLKLVAFVGGLIGWLIGILLPVAILGGVGYLIYRAFGPKSIGSGGRRNLP